MATTSATYQHDYQLSNPRTNPDGSVTYTVTKTSSEVTFKDLAPYGNPDGQVSAGQGVTYFDYDSDDRYSGYMVDGEPVIFWYGYPENPHLYSNEVLPLGAEVTAQQQATYTFCFAAGTGIRTPDGDRPVESLCIGDAVVNAVGSTVAIKWIGRQTRKAWLAALYQELPVRIAAGTLGDGVPGRDLYVSPDHALLVDGCLVQARALVNGHSIRQMGSWAADLDYFHIETEQHELILAEGAPAETFIDNVSRAQFDNHAEYLELYPQAAPMLELDLPRICHRRQLPQAIARRLDARAQQLCAAPADAIAD